MDLSMRYLGLATLKREGWTYCRDTGRSWPHEVQLIAEMIRKHTRRKTISLAMREDAIKIFDMVKSAHDAE